MRRAQELTESCDLFLAIGSSLVVWPAAGFPLAAKRNGARLVIINRDATEFDDIADLVVHDDIGDGARAVHRALIRRYPSVIHRTPHHVVAQIAFSSLPWGANVIAC